MSSTVATIAERPEVRAKAAPLNESLLVASVLVVTAMVYEAVLGFQFVYDDNGQIAENPQILSWRFVPQYFKGQVWQYLFPGAAGNYYRPVNLLWFRINDALFGLRPEGWHAATLLLHLFATYLVYVLARQLTPRPLVAAVTALVFGVHPTRHGVVAWVSGSTESLWTVFFLLAFLAYLRSREGHRVRWMLVSCAMYAIALFSKETAIMLPAVVFMHSLIYGPSASSIGEESCSDTPWYSGRFWPSVRASALIPLAYLPVVVGYMAARTAALSGFSHPQATILLSSLVLTAPSVGWFYARQWLLPIHMSEFYNLQLQHMFSVQHVLLPALVLAAVAAGLWWCRKKLGVRVVEFAIAWMALILLPAFDLAIFPAKDLVHDRYFYCPGFAAALLVGLALEKLASGPLVFRVPQKWLFATLFLLVLMAYSTANASSYWIDDYILFQHAYQTAPANDVVRNNFAVELGRQQRFSEAMPMLKQILQEDPRSWLANYNLARLLYQQHQLPQAEEYYRRAIAIDPSAADGQMQLGLIELQTNRSALAEQDIRRATILRPAEATFHFSLGIVLAQRGDCVDARSEFATALALKPDLMVAKQQSDLCKQSTIANSPASVPSSPASH